MLSKLRLLTKIKRFQWVVIIVLGALVAWLVYLRRHGYTWIDLTGFEGKTIWDVAELLIIPGTLAVVAIILDKQERKADRELTLDNQREAALQNYFDAMTRLILDKDLKKPGQEDDVRDIAQAKTLTTLERLDRDRKGKFVKFLGEVSLVTGGKEIEPPIISLKGVCLGGANLVRANLVRANLERANLRNTNLWNVNLEGANLKLANLSDAQLNGAHLENANLQGANLAGANLEDANLKLTNLNGATLENASLVDTQLNGAHLENANLKGANLVRTQLEDAIMPDGLKYDPAIHTIEKLTGRKPQKT